MSPNNPSNILVIKHGALGDLMQSIGILADIRHQYSDSTITLITAPAYCQLMKRCPSVDHVVADKRYPIWRVDQQIKLKKKLKPAQFDLVIDLQNSDRSHMYRQFWFSKTAWIGRNAAEEEPESGLSGLINLLDVAGIPIPHVYAPDMTWMVEDVTGMLNKKGVAADYIALIPGSSAKHPEKRWPYFSALATALIEQRQSVVVLLGPDEAELGKQMPGAIVDNLNWFELAGVLNGAQYIVGNDTGPSHIASYLNKAGIAIFGPTTSAARAEIGRRNFETVEVDSLESLKVKQVLSKVLGAIT